MDLAVSTRTLVFPSEIESNQTPAVSPPEPTNMPILRDRKPSMYNDSLRVISNPCAIRAVTAAFRTSSNGLEKVVSVESDGSGVDAHPASAIEAVMARIAADITRPVIFLTRLHIQDPVCTQMGPYCNNGVL